MATSVQFNGLDLNDGTTYITHSINHTGPPIRNLPIFDLARAHGMVMTDSLYGAKIIPHAGRIKGTSVADIESKIDTFNQTISGFKKNLDIGYAGSTRRYVATASKAEVTRQLAASIWAEFNVEYTVTAFGVDTAATTLINNVANTTASYAPVITVGGSAPLQPLLLTITVTAATGLSTKTITVTTAAGLSLAVRRTWVVGDVLTIDEANYSVSVGGNAVDFTGFFPTLAPSASTQTLTITNDFTTRTLTYNISQIKRWL